MSAHTGEQQRDERSREEPALATKERGGSMIPPSGASGGEQNRRERGIGAVSATEEQVTAAWDDPKLANVLYHDWEAASHGFDDGYPEVLRVRGERPSCGGGSQTPLQE